MHMAFRTGLTVFACVFVCVCVWGVGGGGVSKKTFY